MNILKLTSIVVLFVGCNSLLYSKGLEAKTVLDMQSSSKSSSFEWVDAKLGKGYVRLINLHEGIGRWYVYEYQHAGSTTKVVTHIENPFPAHELSLVKDKPGYIDIDDGNSNIQCDLLSSEITAARDASLKVNDPYTAICENRLYLRNKTTGKQSAKEFVVDFLRNNIWGGEAITSFVKDTFFSDKFLLGSIGKILDKAVSKPKSEAEDAGLPKRALIDPKFEKSMVKPRHLGFSMLDVTDDQMLVGEWYKIKGHEDIYTSVIQAQFIDASIFETHKDNVSKLDKVENSAQSYLVAYDLSKFDLFFSMGTDHPSVGWSNRTRENMRDKATLGPDGLDSIAPLVSTGKVNPLYANGVVSAFTGGFKRSHGAFKWGPLSEINKGSHYGFIEEGVVFSSLTPNLATLYVKIDGTIGMKTWEAKDDAMIPSLRYARQNGVPIIDGINSVTGVSVPGKYVNKWGPGNWSGSEQSQQRALRAGVCLQSNGTSNYLIYGYFSSVTANAMARIFQAYGCSYAFHLDMNALEHTYLALYSYDKENYNVEHLINGMDVLDSTHKGNTLPRFVGMADNRDFFYLMKKK